MLVILLHIKNISSSAKPLEADVQFWGLHWSVISITKNLHDNILKLQNKNLV